MSTPSKLERTRRGARPRGQLSERPRIYPYLHQDVYRRLVEYCAATNQSESAVVQEALLQSLDETQDSLLLMRRLDRLGRALERVHRDLELLSQAFALFLQFWFAQIPTIPPSQKDAARRSSASRFKQFMEHLAEQFSRGRRFLDDLPKEHFANDEELEALAASTEGSAEPKDRSS